MNDMQNLTGKYNGTENSRVDKNPGRTIFKKSADICTDEEDKKIRAAENSAPARLAGARRIRYEKNPGMNFFDKPESKSTKKTV